MQNIVFLGVEDATFNRFEQLAHQLKHGVSDSIAEEMGHVLADMSCHVVDQVFSEIANIREHADIESENTLQHIKDNLKKYMPWAMAFLSNDRLAPLVEYLQNQMYSNHQQHYLTYRVSDELLNKATQQMQNIQSGKADYIVSAFSVFTQIVDQGIEQLIDQPKKLLKFNFVVDKTLSGVIRLTTQMGYKRIEKIATQFDLEHAQNTLMHFFSFLEHPQQTSDKE